MCNHKPGERSEPGRVEGYMKGPEDELVYGARAPNTKSSSGPFMYPSTRPGSHIAGFEVFFILNKLLLSSKQALNSYYGRPWID